MTKTQGNADDKNFSDCKMHLRCADFHKELKWLTMIPDFRIEIELTSTLGRFAQIEEL